jgi:hypothetical protein
MIFQIGKMDTKVDQVLYLLNVLVHRQQQQQQKQQQQNRRNQQQHPDSALNSSPRLDGSECSVFECDDTV